MRGWSDKLASVGLLLRITAVAWRARPVRWMVRLSDCLTPMRWTGSSLSHGALGDTFTEPASRDEPPPATVFAGPFCFHDRSVAFQPSRSGGGHSLGSFGENMPFAIELYFDDLGESRLRSLSDAFSRFGAPAFHVGESRPHVSLVVAESVDLLATRALLDRFSRSTRRFPVSLPSLGFFLVERVAFLAPKVTPDILALHASFFAEFASISAGIWRHYHPASWVPHCTLAVGLLPQHILPAFEACQACGLPVDCTIVGMGLVEFLPVKQIHAASFSA